MIAPPHPSFYHVVTCKLKVGRKKLLERLALIRIIKSLLVYLKGWPFWLDLVNQLQCDFFRPLLFKSWTTIRTGLQYLLDRDLTTRWHYTPSKQLHSGCSHQAKWVILAMTLFSLNYLIRSYFFKDHLTTSLRRRLNVFLVSNIYRKSTSNFLLPWLANQQ